MRDTGRSAGVATGRRMAGGGEGDEEGGDEALLMKVCEAEI